METKKYNISESILAFIAFFTALFFLLSFVYLSEFFDILGIDISNIPLSITDYTLSVKSFWQNFAGSIIVLSLAGALGIYDAKILDKLKEESKDRPIFNFISYDSIYYFGIALMLYSIGDNLFNLFSGNNYSVSYVGVFTCFFALLAYFSKSKFIIFIFVVSFFPFKMYDVAKRDALSTMLYGQSSFQIKDEKYKLIRTFDNGVLILDNEKTFKFMYNDNEKIIDLGKNLKLMNFIQEKTAKEKSSEQANEAK